MRNPLKNTFGKPSGYYYPDGTPVLVGDRLALPDCPFPATVRVRHNKNHHGLYYYSTYSFLGKVVTKALTSFDKFVRYAEPKREPKPTPAPPIITVKIESEKKGKSIVGLLDYDTAIIK